MRNGLSGWCSVRSGFSFLCIRSCNKKDTPGRAFCNQKHQVVSPSKLANWRIASSESCAAFEPSVTGWGCACAFLGREKGAWTWLRRHPLIDPIFSRFPGINLRSREGTSTSSPCKTTGFSRYFPDIHFLRIPRSCRVPQGSEPAVTGWVRLGASALARAYRVMRRKMGPRGKGVGSGRCMLHHEHSRASVLYHRVMGMQREKLITDDSGRTKCPPRCICLWINSFDRARIWDRLADVFDAADPGHGPLDAHAKAGVGDRAESTQFKVPL